MSLIASDLSSDLYNFFKSMGGGMSNSKFAKDFSDIINDWYMDNSDGTTIDAGTISSGAFLGSGKVDSIDSNSSSCSTIIETCCNLIDSTKPKDAKDKFAECIAKGIVTMINASTIKCKVNGTATSGSTLTPISNADSEGHIIIFDVPTTIEISEFETPYSSSLKLPSNLTKNSIKIKYKYNDVEYASEDDGDGNIVGDFLSGTVDYIKGNISLELDGDIGLLSENIFISYSFTSDFKGDVLDVLNDLEVQEGESENDWKTRLGGDADKYFADKLSNIIQMQITSVILTTIGKGDISGSVGTGKLF